MVRIAYDYPSVENAELFESYTRTSPQLYSSIASTDKYLVRYASNTWNIQFPNCTFHPPTNTLHIPIPFIDDKGKTFYLDLPYQGLSVLSFTQHPNPSTNSITLEALCEVYFLAENVIIRLPGSSELCKLYTQIPLDGLTFSISYLDIPIHKIRDNLTKLAISISEYPNDELVIYPLQRFPPQPLALGVFQPYSNLTPLQSLQLVNDAIIQGSELAKNMIEFTRVEITNKNLTIPSINLRDNEIMLSQSGYGDDDNYDSYNNFRIDESTNGSTGMHVEMIGGFNSSGVKRSRRESSGDNSSSSTSLNNRGNINNNTRPSRPSTGASHISKHKRMFYSEE